MLDIRLIRERPDFVHERLATHSPEYSGLVDEVLKVNSERRRLETELQRLNAERNQLSKTIGLLRSKKEATADKEAKVRAIGEEIVRLNEAVGALDQSQTKLMLGVPNLPHAG